MRLGESKGGTPVGIEVTSAQDIISLIEGLWNGKGWANPRIILKKKYTKPWWYTEYRQWRRG